VAYNSEANGFGSFFAGDLDRACEEIIGRVHKGAGGYVCQANVHVVVTSWHDRRVHAALEDASMVFPDGAPIAWIMRTSGAREAQRIAGADLMARLFQVGQADRLRHFLFGSTPEVLRKLEDSLHARYPEATIAGRYAPGAVSGADPVLSDTTAMIRNAEPDVVWCCLGAPKQELWMRQHARLLEPALLIGVGAAFDFLAGTKKRAPEWMQRSGLEWAHRLALEPRRLAGRYLRTNSEFVVRMGLGLLKRKAPRPD